MEILLVICELLAKDSVPYKLSEGGWISIDNAYISLNGEFIHLERAIFDNNLNITFDDRDLPLAEPDCLPKLFVLLREVCDFYRSGLVAGLSAMT